MVRVREMREADAPAIAALAQRVIGPGYYPEATVLEYLERSTLHPGPRVCSHVAVEGERLAGFRFAFPPGRWSTGRGVGLHVERWPAPLERAAYFQSIYLDPDFTGRGLGRRLSERSLAVLAELGAEVVVAHSWKESPHNSSLRYLTKLGFVPVAEIPDYWAEVDYVCVLDGSPCRCTAVEVILSLHAEAS